MLQESDGYVDFEDALEGMGSGGFVASRKNSRMSVAGDLNSEEESLNGRSASPTRRQWALPTVSSLTCVPRLKCVPIGRKMGYVVALTVLASVVAWLIVVSSAVSNIGSDYTKLNAEQNVHALVPLSGCSIENPVQVGMTVSMNQAGGQSLVVGAGTTAYQGAQQLTFTTNSVKHIGIAVVNTNMLVLAFIDAAGVAWASVGVSGFSVGWVDGSTQLFNTSAGASSSFPPPVADGSIQWSAPLQLPVVIDVVQTVQRVGAGQEHFGKVLFLGGGKAVIGVVETLSGAPTLRLGPGASYAPSSESIVQSTVAVLSTTAVAVSHYVMNEHNRVVLRTSVGSILGVTLAFSKPVVFSPNHDTHASEALGQCSYLLGFPNDEQLNATDDDTVGTPSPLGLLIAVVSGIEIGCGNSSTFEVRIYGANGPAPLSGPLQLATPWKYPGSAVQGFFDILTVVSVNLITMGPEPVPAARSLRNAPRRSGHRSSDKEGGDLGSSSQRTLVPFVAQTSLVVIAFSDASGNGAIRTLSARVVITSLLSDRASVQSIEFEWLDNLYLTAGGVDVGYKFFSIVPVSTPMIYPTPYNTSYQLGEDLRFAIVFADMASGGGVFYLAAAVASSSGALRSLQMSRIPLSPPLALLDPGNAEPAESDTFWISADVLDSGQVIVATSVTIQTKGAVLGNLTVIEAWAKPAGIVLNSKGCPQSGPNGPQPSALVLASGFGQIPAGVLLGPIQTGSDDDDSSTDNAPAALPTLQALQMIYATTRGYSIPSRSSTIWLPTSFGPVDVVVGDDACIGRAVLSDPASDGDSNGNTWVGIAACMSGG
jgi:hypothetical protein